MAVTQRTVLTLTPEAVTAVRDIRSQEPDAGELALAIGICIFVGVLAGFIPARQASRMDPVAAIRSK